MICDSRYGLTPEHAVAAPALPLALRALVDLGRQLEAMRAQRDEMEAELQEAITERCAVQDENTTLRAEHALLLVNARVLAARLADEHAQEVARLRAAISEYLHALDAATAHVMRTDDDCGAYDALDARLTAAESAMRAAATRGPR